MEFFQTVGLCTLVFLVLPRMDMFRGCLILCSAAVIPGISKIAFGRAPRFGAVSEHVTKKRFAIVWYVANFLALITQAASLAILLLSNYETTTADKAVRSDSYLNLSTRRDILIRAEPESSNNFERWYAPLALVLLSITWWENFIEKDIDIFGRVIPLKGWKEQMHAWRQKTTFFISIWNIVIVIVFPYLVFSPFKMEIVVTNYLRKDNVQLSTNLAPLFVQIFTTVGGFYMGNLSCKLCMQIVTYNLPLLLTTPVTLAMIALQCKFELIPIFGSPYVFWNCPEFVAVNFNIFEFEIGNWLQVSRPFKHKCRINAH